MIKRPSDLGVYDWQELLAELIIGGATAYHPSTTWAPTDISGCQLWLRAEDLSGLSDGDDIATWDDRSGNSRDFARAAAGKTGKYYSSVVNGKAVARFDGTDDMMTYTGNVSDFVATNEGTVAVVLCQKSVDARAGYFCGVAPDNNNRLFCLDYDGKLYYDFGKISAGGRISDSEPGSYDDNWHYLIFRRLSTGAGVIRVDGADVVTGTYTDDMDITQAVTMYLGASSATANEMEGDIAEIIVYNVGLSDADVSTLESHLGTYYSI